MDTGLTSFSRRKGSSCRESVQSKSFSSDLWSASLCSFFRLLTAAKVTATAGTAKTTTGVHRTTTGTPKLNDDSRELGKWTVVYRLYR